MGFKWCFKPIKSDFVVDIRDSSIVSIERIVCIIVALGIVNFGKYLARSYCIIRDSCNFVEFRGFNDRLSPSSSCSLE